MSGRHTNRPPTIAAARVALSKALARREPAPPLVFTDADKAKVAAYYALDVHRRWKAFQRLTPVQQRLAKEMYTARHRIGVGFYER